MQNNAPIMTVQAALTFTGLPDVGIRTLLRHLHKDGKYAYQWSRILTWPALGWAIKDDPSKLEIMAPD